MRIGKVRIADPRPVIPLEHGINGLGELGATRLVDAARIDPDPFEPVFERLSTAVFDLPPPELQTCVVKAAHVREDDLVHDFGVPRM